MSWKVSMVAPSGSGMVMAVQHAAVPALEFQRHLDPVLDSRHCFADGLPGVGVIEQRLAPGLPRSRYAAARAAPPATSFHIHGECRIEQLRAAIAAEHATASVRLSSVSRCTRNQAFEAAGRDRGSFGDVIEQIWWTPPSGFGVDDDADRRGHRGRNHGILFRLDRAIGLMQLGLPGPGNPAAPGTLRAVRQPVEHAGTSGLLSRKTRSRVPEAAIGIIGRRRAAAGRRIPATPEDN